MTFHPLEHLHRLYDGYSRAFQVAGRALLLLQAEGRTYIIANQCPHMNAPLTHAKLQGDIICCPLHRFEYKLSSGQPARAEFAGGGQLQHFPVAYEGSQVGVWL